MRPCFDGRPTDVIESRGVAVPPRRQREHSDLTTKLFETKSGRLRGLSERGRRCVGYTRHRQPVARVRLGLWGHAAQSFRLDVSRRTRCVTIGYRDVLNP